jgi:hypothetical protein
LFRNTELITSHHKNLKTEKKIELQTSFPMEKKSNFLQYINDSSLFNPPQLVHFDILRKQKMHTCKIVALTNLLDFLYQTGQIAHKPIELYKNKNKNILSARYLAKKFSGSSVGEIYHDDMAITLIKKQAELAGDHSLLAAKIHFNRFPHTDKYFQEKQYIEYIKKQVDEKMMSVIFYDIDDEGFPLVNGNGKREHAAVVIGYALSKLNPELYFIVSHWETYFIIKATNLAQAANNLSDFRQPETFVKVKNIRENCSYYFCITTSGPALMKYLNGNLKLFNSISKLKHNENILVMDNFIFTKKYGKDITANKGNKGFKLTVCNIYPEKKAPHIEKKQPDETSTEKALNKVGVKLPSSQYTKFSSFKNMITLKYLLWNCQEVPVFNKSHSTLDFDNPQTTYKSR